MHMVVMAPTRSGGGRVGLRGDGVQNVLGYRGFLMVALLFVTATTFGIKDVHCSSPTEEAKANGDAHPWQEPEVILTFNQYEEDALYTVFLKWSKENPQLFYLLNWHIGRHPCDNREAILLLSIGSPFPGIWRGVGCYAQPLNITDFGRSYHISLISLEIPGNDLSCLDGDYHDDFPCGFHGIIGELPSEISNLTNLEDLTITHNPRLTGSVPVEFFQMPNLVTLDLSNNSLSGTLPSDIYNPDCKLSFLDLSNNNFSGSLRESSNSTLFCLSLYDLDLSNNHFEGTFSIGPYVDVEKLDLSYNDFTSIRFSNYSGTTHFEGTVYMPSLANLNISNNNFSGPFLKELFQMPSLTNLDLSANHFVGSIDYGSLDDTAMLKYLNVSNNNFKGTFIASAYHNANVMDLSNNQFNDITFHMHNETSSNDKVFLPILKEIYFQNNKLSGRFPNEILTAPLLQILDASQNGYDTLQLPILQLKNFSLSQILITKNKLDAVQYPESGPLSSYNLQFSSLLFLGGNPRCNKIENMLLTSICRLNPTDEPQPVIPKVNTKMKIIIATSTSSTVILVLLIAAIYVWRLIGKIKALHIILEEFDKKEVKPNLYSYKEVKLATNNFDKNNKLGEGGFGVVYKGELFDGTQVAVKKLTMSSNQVLHEFLNEVITIFGLKHRNLVKLKGCCLGDGDQRILVFEYVENNNLAEALWNQGDLPSNCEFPCLDWETRFNIIFGIARGLAYLHEELQPPIIHRDIKAANILLDKNYNPKIADFGLAYLFPTLDNKASHLTLMQIAGTRGYCSPEYILHGHVSTALDVYSFGILVLEIVSGRKNIDLQKPSEEIYLREWAWKQYEAKATMTLIDPRMEHSPLALDAIMRVVDVALACVHYKAARRPKMHDVLPMLLGNMPITEFQRDFEYGEEIVEVCAKFPLTLGSTSIFWSNANLHVDDCCLLSNLIDGIEMNSIVRSNG